MDRYELVYLTTAQRNLAHLRSYIVRTSGEAKADSFIAQVMEDCDSLRYAPMRGTVRTQLGQQVRMIGVAKGRASVAFRVEGNEVKLQQ